MAQRLTKIRRIVCALLAVVAVLLFAVGCASDKKDLPPADAETVTVTFYVGSDVYETVEVAKGYTVGEIKDPVREGTDKVDYSFVGWFTDPDFFDYFDVENTAVREDMTLYAKFNESVVVTKGMAAVYAVVGFIIVLVVLALLVGIFYLLGAVFNSKLLNGKGKKKEPVTNAAVESADTDEGELVAAITAAITAVLAEENSDVVPEFVIRRVKRKS